MNKGLARICLFFFSLFVKIIFAQNSLLTPVSPNIGWVSVGDLDISGNQITIEAIVRRTNNSNQGNIVSKHIDPSNVNYSFRMAGFLITTTKGFYNCVINNSIFSYEPNKWYHVAGTYDGSFIRYYINGCLYKELPANGNLVLNDFITAIGTQSNNISAEHFRGNLDEVRIWKVARTQKEIHENMNDLIAPQNQVGLMAYYKFDNDYINVQGNSAWNGIANGTPSFSTQPPIFPILAIQNISKIDATCYGSADASLVISASGQGLTFSLDGVNFQPDSSFNDITGGEKTIYVKNQFGCLVSKSYSIGRPNQVPTPIIKTNTPICSQDTLTMSVDSISGVTCRWNGPNGFSSQLFVNVFDKIDVSFSGDYSVYYMFNGCSSDTSVKPIIVNPIYSFQIDTTICSNKFYSLGNQELNQIGIYSADLKTVAGCDSLIKLNLNVNPAFSFSRDTSICEDDIFIYQGQTLNTSGTYPFYLKTNRGCDSTITYNLTVYPTPPPPVLMNNSPLICPGDPYFMYAEPLTGGTFSWSGPNQFVSNNETISFNAEIEEMGTYTATVSVNGCESPSSKIELTIENIFTFDDFEFPNVLTANSDGTNDKLDLDNYFKTCQEYTFYIYNRWGNLIYQNKNNEPPFEGQTLDGKQAQDGVYSFRLDYEKGIKSGFFHLIR